jgi:putative transposase
MVSVNVVAAESAEVAQKQFETMRRTRIRNEPRRSSDTPLTEEEAEVILHSPEGAYIRQMFTYTAIGTREMVASYLADFLEETGADELITAHRAGRVQERIRSVELTGELIHRD